MRVTEKQLFASNMDIQVTFIKFQSKYHIVIKAVHSTQKTVKEITLRLCSDFRKENINLYLDPAACYRLTSLTTPGAVAAESPSQLPAGDACDQVHVGQQLPPQ